MKPLSPTKQKILLLLFAGVALSCAPTLGRQARVFKRAAREWKRIDEQALRTAIRDLYRSKLIDGKQNRDGTHTFVLSEKGKKKALTYQFETMKIEKKKWDGKWRFVCFDIPESLKSSRDALRRKLLDVGFRELQKSMFVIPFECLSEIEFIIEYFRLRAHVRYGVIDAIDNELHLKKMFELS
ncbi:hypothetical protein HY732_01245 [Candidatus Uhrbacteria bacterium]|nr:hypothetical protein [Candidatus Uhrbacteria bacterium]